MGYREFEFGRSLLVRAKNDSEIIASVTELAKKEYDNDRDLYGNRCFKKRQDWIL